VIGETVSQFKIIEKIGEGGRGVVYKARDLKLKRMIALKFLPEKLITDSEQTKRFEREAQAAAVLNHPNIVTIYDINTYENQLYIAMEFVDGWTLSEEIKKHSSFGVNLQRLKDFYSIIQQICSGLNKAHEAGIVHRDIKPQNIMIDRENRVKILDFGIAKLKGASKLTEKHKTVGTLLYISPEQLRGDELDHRSDIWSLGVVMHEMLTGQLAFKGVTPEEIVNSILNKEPAPLTGVDTCIPKSLEKVILRTLTKESDKRYQDIETLSNDLKSVSHGDNPLSQEGEALPENSEHSIAVLSFADMSPKKDQEYFCDGIAEELINSLTKIKGLKVASRTSSFQFKGANCDIAEINRKLKVKTLLEGSVRKDKKKLRISVQLINAADGYHIWSESYDSDLKDIFAIQDKITLAVVHKLKLQLLGDDKEKLSKRYTLDQLAFNLFLKGRFFWNRRYEGGLRKSIECFKQAIKEDPNYALPYVGIADSLNVLGLYSYMAPIKAFPEATVAINKALNIDESIGEAHASLGWISTFYDWNWQKAEAEFKKAIELNPNYATAHEWYSLYLAIMGRLDESLTEIEKALELDPLSLIINCVLGLIQMFTRKYDEAIVQFEKVLEMDPNFLLAHIWLGETHLFKENYQEAIAEAQKAVEVAEGMTYALADLGFAYSLTGQKDKAQEVLDKLAKIERQSHISQLQKAFIYMGLGDTDQVFKLYEQGYKERDSFFTWFKVAPHFDSIRSETRFKEYLKLLNLDI
jgi:serine/threonine protein kinase/Tfp pilus assembly protein PilF